MEAKLEHNLSSVRLNRPDRDSQLRCDLLIGFPLSQEADNLDLARCRSRASPLPSQMLASSFQKPIKHDFGDLGGYETLTVGNGFYGFCEALREIGFQKVSAGPDLQCTANHVV